MALKFYKVLNGLKTLFKDTRPTDETQSEQISNTSIDNLTDSSKNKGVDNNSIVIAQATAEDSKVFGGKYIPGTNVMFANGQTFVDASNIVQGVYTKVTTRGNLIFCAPKGSFLESDKVQFARHVHQHKAGDYIYNGIVVPGATLDNDTYQQCELHLRKQDTSPVVNSVWNYVVYVTNANGDEISLIDYLTGLNLNPLKTVAFSVYRNGVQITDWFTWEVNYDTSGAILGLKRSKGLYLPGIKEIKYKNLVDLVNNAKLVPGRYYKIIDYYPTTNLNYNMTDGAYPLEDRGYLNSDRTDEKAKDNVMVSPRWQIIVQALTKDWINENALAFNGGWDGNNHVCKIKYSLLGNSTKYPWANSTSTGVIYYMEDQNGNSANYDFKNLKFTGVKIADNSVLTNSTKIGQIYNKDSSVILTKDLTGSHWTFESLSGDDLSSTNNCTNCHIETPTPQRVILMSAKMDNCRVLSTSSDSTIYGNSVLNHVVLDRAKDCYAFVTLSGIEHVNILGNSHWLLCKGNLVYSNITNSDITILSASEIKNVNTKGYYGGPLTLMGTSFQHINFVDYCAQIRILGVAVGGTAAAPTYSLGGYILYGQFNSARSLVLKTNGKHFTNFTFLPGDYKANFVTPSDAGIGDQGSYTFIGGNYNTNATPTETNGSWNREVKLERANKINNLYAPSASKFTLL